MNGRRRHPRAIAWTAVAGLGATAMLLQLFAPAALAQTEEEEDQTIGGGNVVLSVPDDVSDERRETARSDGFSLTRAMSVYAGSDDNLYRSPGDQEQRGSSWGSWVQLKADRRWSSRSRARARAAWQQSRYPDHGNLDSRYLWLDATYVGPLSERSRFELHAGATRNNDDAATILGEDYVRDYSYWRWEIDADVVWSPDPHHRFTASLGHVNRDYGETPGLTSIDWASWGGGVAYRYRFGPYHYLGAKYTASHRVYVEEPAALVTGREIEGNPEERHLYEDYALSYTVPVGGRVGLQLTLDHAKKSDLFQGYEDYSENGVRLTASARFAGRWETRLLGRLASRAYAHEPADDGRPLEYKRWQVSAGSRVRVTGPFWIFGNVGYFGRDTNKSSGIIYRSYRGVVPTAGMSFFF